MAEMKLSELAKLIDGELSGDGEVVIRGLATIESAGPDEVTFLTNNKYVKHVEATRAAAVIVAKNYAGPGARLLRCKDPYFAFREAMVAFYGFRQPYFEGVDARAVVDPSARLAPDARVAPFAVIGPQTVIGPGAVIYSGVNIGPRCRIGGGCTLYPNVTLYDGTILHDRVTIHAGTSIGHDGFGYATHNGRHEKIPQVGWVELEDDVEIGANCAIDRATMGPTVVGAGTKFSNLVAIGHGTRLGKGCLLVAQTGIAGSVVVGNYCVFGGQAGIVGHIKIGDGAHVAAKTGVTNDLAPGEEVFGVPSIPLRLAKRTFTILPRLPQMRAALKKLIREFRQLHERVTGEPADGRPKTPDSEDF
jgi:UDP-3-O-[3-hydroxymyristoyl] glucosamine N-acyltransferase